MTATVRPYQQILQPVKRQEQSIAILIPLSLEGPTPLDPRGLQKVRTTLGVEVFPPDWPRF